MRSAFPSGPSAARAARRVGDAPRRTGARGATRWSAPRGPAGASSFPATPRPSKRCAPLAETRTCSCTRRRSARTSGIVPQTRCTRPRARPPRSRARRRTAARADTRLAAYFGPELARRRGRLREHGRPARLRRDRGPVRRAGEPQLCAAARGPPRQVGAAPDKRRAGTKSRTICTSRATSVTAAATRQCRTGQSCQLPPRRTGTSRPSPSRPGDADVVAADHEVDVDPLSLMRSRSSSPTADA